MGGCVGLHCLVTGASGYIGEALTDALVQRGCRVTAHCGRRPGAAESFACAQALHGDLDELDARALQGVACVFHLAAIAHQGARPADYQRVNVDASLTLAQRALDAGVRRFVFFSSVKAALVESPAVGDLDYAGSKALAEKRLEDFCRDKPMRLVIVRPALVYGGSEKGHLKLLGRWVRWHLPRPPAGGARSLIARSDVVDLALRLLDSDVDATPMRITLSDGEAYTTQRLHGALCRRLGRNPWFPSPPVFAWRVACELFDALRRTPRGATWQRLAGEEVYPPEGLAELGFVPRFTFESALGLEDRQVDRVVRQTESGGK